MHSETESPIPKKPNPARLLFLGAFLLIAIWLGLKTWRIVQATQSLQAAQAEVENMMADGLTAIRAGRVFTVSDRREEVNFHLRDGRFRFQPEGIVFRVMVDDDN